MDSPEKIPLDEAVGRGLIACAACGKPGAAVRETGGKKHFLCPACEARSRRFRLAGVGLLLAAAAAILILARPKSSSPDDGPTPEVLAFKAEIEGLLREGKAREARGKLLPVFKRNPGSGFVNTLMGQTLMTLGYYESAVPHFKAALQHPEAPEECRFWLALAIHRMDRAADALPLLEKPFTSIETEEGRKRLLVECLVEVGRAEEGLKLIEGLPVSASSVWVRHRALTLLGRPEEAEQALASLDPQAARDPGARSTQADLRSRVLREDGDFKGALSVLETAVGSVPPRSPSWFKLTRGAFMVHIEAGEPARIKADDLAGASDPLYQGEAMWYRALALLLTGDREGARAAARELLEKSDPEYSQLRLERLMARHLTGQAWDADVEKEAKASSAVRANDLYWYLAVATGDRAWAEKGLAITPGHNFPYHALRRLVGK